MKILLLDQLKEPERVEKSFSPPPQLSSSQPPILLGAAVVHSFPLCGAFRWMIALQLIHLAVERQFLAFGNNGAMNILVKAHFGGHLMGSLKMIAPVCIPTSYV